MQVKAATSYIKKVINDSTGKQFEPFPVVLFPGWFVEGNRNRQGKLWVLERKTFKKFLDRQTVKLSDEDVKLGFIPFVTAHQDILMGIKLSGTNYRCFRNTFKLGWYSINRATLRLTTQDYLFL